MGDPKTITINFYDFVKNGDHLLEALCQPSAGFIKIEEKFRNDSKELERYIVITKLLRDVFGQLLFTPSRGRAILDEALKKIAEYDEGNTTRRRLENTRPADSIAIADTHHHAKQLTLPTGPGPLSIFASMFAVAGCLVWLLLRRRRKKPEEPPDTTTSEPEPVDLHNLV